jgi:hypothetical protein
VVELLEVVGEVAQLIGGLRKIGMANLVFAHIDLAVGLAHFSTRGPSDFNPRVIRALFRNQSFVPQMMVLPEFRNFHIFRTITTERASFSVGLGVPINSLLPAPIAEI